MDRTSKIVLTTTAVVVLSPCLVMPLAFALELRDLGLWPIVSGIIGSLIFAGVVFYIIRRINRRDDRPSGPP